MLAHVATEVAQSTTDGRRRSRWTARVLRMLPAVVLLLALCAVTTISIVAFEDAYVVDVTVQSRQLKDVVLTSTTISGIKPAAQGFVVFDFLGGITRSVAGLRLNIHSARDSTWHSQPCCQISGGSFFGTAQLGSQQWPLREDEWYTFQLLAQPGDIVLAEGTIHAGVTAVQTTPSWVRRILMWLAVLATVAQVVQVFHQICSLVEARSRTGERK